MILPGPVIGGPPVSVVWSPPRPTFLADRHGRIRPGWTSTAYACALGHPDQEAGDAQAPDRVTLRLLQAYGTLRIAVELLLHRIGWHREERQDDP